MGYFKNSMINDYDRDPQKYCPECNKQISDNDASEFKGKCKVCFEKAKLHK
ncbi:MULTISPECIES: hypothetical protein [Bacillus cereus group]|uniref:hypothetical protein n=1 Tax=Bacillus cereus group TaxID=86661 RepID=UPI0001A026AB|nr:MULTISPECIES: hypothetical protein [Bacillus cereus group]EEK64448.1 hypothetical protein bcere0006_54040 [Bacillus wiedmannii]MDA2665531.1 hypothetical protein [Bacillus cereus group sp. Bc032]MDA2676317.1 hypothetical protein [Bacillus cereus group sp. Bc031]MDA2681837.1 hypothetical protein [Bacillus cereus group sp. Bc029]MDA2687293.1 hypothetical protein [Bacillus cereus group sp. Bc030]